MATFGTRAQWDAGATRDNTLLQIILLSGHRQTFEDAEIRQHRHRLHLQPHASRRVRRHGRADHARRDCR